MTASRFFDKYLTLEWIEFMQPILNNENIMMPLISELLPTVRAKIPLVPSLETAFSHFEHIVPSMVTVVLVTDEPFEGSAVTSGVQFYRDPLSGDTDRMKVSAELTRTHLAISSQMNRKYAALAELAEREMNIQENLKYAENLNVKVSLNQELRKVKEAMAELYDKLHISNMPNKYTFSHWHSQGVLPINLQITHVEGNYYSHPSWSSFTLSLIEELVSINMNVLVVTIGESARDHIEEILPRNAHKLHYTEVINSDMFVEINQELCEIYNDPEAMIDWTTTIVQ